MEEDREEREVKDDDPFLFPFARARSPSTHAMASRAAALLVGLAWLVGLAHAASPPAMPAGRIVAAFTGCRPSTVASRSGSGSAPPPAPLGPDARALVLAVSGGPPPGGPEHTAVCRFLTSEGLGALKRAMVRVKTEGLPGG